MVTLLLCSGIIIDKETEKRIYRGECDNGHQNIMCAGTDFLSDLIVCIAVIKCINIVAGFITSKRFVSEHTVMNKICGILMFAIPFCVDRFPWQPVAVLIVVTCTFATVAAIQEGYYIRTGEEAS